MRYFEWIADPKNPGYDKWFIVSRDKKDRYEGWTYNETFKPQRTFVITPRPFIGYEKTSSPPAKILREMIVDTFRRPW